MRTILRDLQGFLVLAVAIGVGAVLLLNNARPAASANPAGSAVVTGVPTQAQDKSWQYVIQANIVDPSQTTPTPIPAALTATPLISLPSGDDQVDQAVGNSTPIAWDGLATPTRALLPTTTQAVPTSVASPIGQVVRRNSSPIQGQFSPPPEIGMLSLDPRDHFWFQRPVDSSANSEQIFWYVYGSDGPQQQWRVHTGIDLPNPIGKEVRAAGPGHVVYAGDHYTWRDADGNVTDVAYTYGNLVVIEHDFGFNGQKLWTLYAHLSAILAKVGEHVDTGDVIGLSGQSGVVSGPHVHFEVRESTNNYYFSRNPILWMAPFLDHGVIAGRILLPDGQPVEDAPVYLQQNGKIVDRSNTYVHPRKPGQTYSGRIAWNVNSDDNWHENFVLGDVATGDYQVVVDVNGVRFSRNVTVHPGTTSYIDFGSPFQATPGAGQ